MDTSSTDTDLMGGAPIQSGASTVVVSSHDLPFTALWVTGGIVLAAVIIGIAIAAGKKR